MIDRGPAWLVGVADAGRIPLGDKAVDLVIGSPPYTTARAYLEDGRDLGIARDLNTWVAWMLRVTAEALRVSRGAVLWVAAGVTRDRNYWPACEALMADWARYGVGSGEYLDGLELPRRRPAECHAYRPCYWHRSGIPGSGGDQWFRADVEYVMCFKRPGELPWSHNTAMGHPPVCEPGGASSNRRPDGLREGLRRAHEAGRPLRAITRRRIGRDVRESDEFYVPPEIANPGNLLRTTGGHLDDRSAHASEAPFPEAVPEFFIRSLVPPGGLVLDPFSGSGSTLAAAARADRRGIGLDLRPSQARLAMQRLSRPHAPAPRASARNGHAPAPLFDRLKDTPC
jgi:hypothetical protein